MAPRVNRLTYTNWDRAYYTMLALLMWISLFTAHDAVTAWGSLAMGLVMSFGAVVMWVTE